MAQEHKARRQDAGLVTPGLKTFHRTGSQGVDGEDGAQPRYAGHLHRDAVGAWRDLPRIELMALVDDVVEGAAGVDHRSVRRRPATVEQDEGLAPGLQAAAMDDERAVPVAVGLVQRDRRYGRLLCRAALEERRRTT